jgi:hypothetical protein
MDSEDLEDLFDVVEDATEDKSFKTFVIAMVIFAAIVLVVAYNMN